jgi:hypothetical protein
MIDGNKHHSDIYKVIQKLKRRAIKINLSWDLLWHLVFVSAVNVPRYIVQRLYYVDLLQYLEIMSKMGL